MESQDTTVVIGAGPYGLSIEPAQRLLQVMGISGMVEIEFKQDQRGGQYKLLDINVRPWG